MDTKNAGYGGLSLSVEGPSKAEIKCKDNEVKVTLNFSSLILLDYKNIVIVNDNSRVVRMEFHLQSSITPLELSITLLKNNYITRLNAKTMR